MKHYTLGFIFDATFEKVVLMTKIRPEWQKGMLNGVGGHVEADETPSACIVREVWEETGLSTDEKDWVPVAVLGNADWHMDVFGLIHRGDAAAIQTKTEERVNWYDVAHLPEAVLSNALWLIYLAKDILQNDEIEKVSIIYRRSRS